MLKKITIFFAVVITAIILTGCPAVLESGLSSDIMITLGLIRPAEGTASILTAVGGTMSVPVMISNLNRNSAAGTYEVTFALSTDAELSTAGDNVAVGAETITAGTEALVALTVPAAITDADVGTYNLIAYFEAAADDPGTLVGTTVYNIGMVQVVIDTAANYLPDLEITFVNPPSKYRQPEASFPLSFKVTNTGNALVATGTAIDVDFDVNINGTDVEKGAAKITLAADLLPNDFVTGSAAITMPTLTEMALDDGVAEADVDAWAGNVVGTVDPDNAITEIDETAGSNTDTFGLNSGTLQPDLVVSAIDVADYSIVEGPVEVSITVRNDGYAAAAAASYGLILFNDVNTDGAYDVGDTIIKQWDAADNPAVPWDVDGNGNNQVVFNGISVDGLTWPTAMTEGDYQIGAVITGDLTEWDNTNNDATAALHLITKKVDLEIVSMTTTYSEVVGTAEVTVPVSLTVKNNGSETVTTDFTIEFYISDNNTLSTADTLVGSLAVTDDIASGEAGWKTFAVDTTIAAATAGGFYTMFAILDSADTVKEMDESNNQPANANGCSIFIPVDDTTTNLSARLMLCYPDNATNDSDGYRQNYGFWGDTSTPWDDTNEDIDTNVDEYISSNESGPQVLEVSNSVTITQTNTHGVRTNATSYRVKLVWRFVPNYVTDLEEQYIPAALTTDDGYEDNDTLGTATALSGAAHPLSSWISSYDSGYNDFDYYTFDF